MIKWIRNEHEWEAVFMKTCRKNGSGELYVLSVQLCPSAKLSFCHWCFRSWGCTVMSTAVSYVCPYKEYNIHVSFSTQLSCSHVWWRFASTSNTLSVYSPWFDLGTHCSFLLMRGHLRAGINSCVDTSQVSLMCQTVVLWHVSATSIFAKIVSLQNIHKFKQLPPMTKTPPVGELWSCKQDMSALPPWAPGAINTVWAGRLARVQISCKNYSVQQFACLFLIYIVSSLLYFLLNSKEKELFTTTASCVLVCIFILIRQ